MNKSILLVVGIILFLSTNSFGQINLKPHIGANYTSLSSDPNDWLSEAKAGTVIGLGVQIGGRLYLEPGLQWTNATVKLVPNVSQLSGDVEMNFVGFRIPLMVGYRLLGEGDGFNVRIFAGPSVMLNTKSEINSDLPELSEATINNAIWGANIGAGLDFLFLYFEIGYEAGLNTLTKEDIENWNDPKRNLFYLTLGANL